MRQLTKQEELVEQQRTLDILSNDTRHYTEWAKVQMARKTGSVWSDVTNPYNWCTENVGVKGKVWTWRPNNQERTLDFFFRHDSDATMFSLVFVK